MKFYCILYDTMPYAKDLETIAESKNLNFHHQISNAFTTTSVFSLLTGKLPSQIFQNGFGYNSEELLSNEPIWCNSILFDHLKKDGWEIRLHNSVWINDVIYNRQEKNFFYSTSYPGGYEKEKKHRWGLKEIENLTIEKTPQSLEMLESEKKFIKQFQEEKTEKNIFYFIIYHHYHAAAAQSRNHNIAREYMLELMNSWDYNEENSIFWSFADHGNFQFIDSWCTPPHAINTWAISKNNIFADKRPKKLISILDFFETFKDIFQINIKSNELAQSIYGEQDKERIYFFEDSRSYVDLHKSTTAGAVVCSEWSENYPVSLLQFSYNKPFKQSKYFSYNLSSLFLEEINYSDKITKQNIEKIFNWTKETNE